MLYICRLNFKIFCGDFFTGLAPAGKVLDPNAVHTIPIYRVTEPEETISSHDHTDSSTAQEGHTLGPTFPSQATNIYKTITYVNLLRAIEGASSYQPYQPPPSEPPCPTKKLTNQTQNKRQKALRTTQLGWTPWQVHVFSTPTVVIVCLLPAWCIPTRSSVSPSTPQPPHFPPPSISLTTEKSADTTPRT